MVSCAKLREKSLNALKNISRGAYYATKIFSSQPYNMNINISCQLEIVRKNILPFKKRFQRFSLLCLVFCYHVKNANFSV